MIKAYFTVTALKEESDYAQLVLEPLEQGYGHTLGNSLRRVLLSSLGGAAITAVKMEGVQHQFSTLEGLEQDVVELILNLKQVRFAYSGDEPVTAHLRASGKTTVTAGDIDLPANVKVANPTFKLATLTDTKARLDVELTIERGSGYSLAEERKSTILGVMPIDATFTPVVRVAYRVEATRVGRRTDFDRLILEIWTDGTIAPREALDEAAKILVDHFRQIFEPVVVEASEEPAEETTVVGEVYRLTVEELDLPTRIANALRKGGFKTVKDLATASPATLQQVKNLGEKSAKVVLKALKKKGIDLE